MIKLNRKLNKEQQLKNKGSKIMIKNRKLKEIPVFFATDDNYVPYLVVSIRSLIDTASANNTYSIYVLNTGLKDANKKALKDMETANVKIGFVDLTEKVKDIYSKLQAQLRDYYSPSIYYRLFIPTMFPKYKKALYLDCDITILEDVANLYNHDLKNNLVGAIVDEVVTSNEVFRYYVSNALGVNEYKYFNSGILVMNLDAFRKEKFEEKFIYLLNNYNFGTVAPDQDYLNVLCKGRILYIEKAWNKMPVSNEGFDEKDLKLVHYNMFQKPWKYEGILYEKYFWQTAQKTPYYDFFKQTLANFDDAKKLKDQQAGEKLLAYAKNIADDPNNFKNTLNGECICLAEKQNIEMKAIEEICVLEDFLKFIFAEDEPIGSECC